MSFHGTHNQITDHGAKSVNGTERSLSKSPVRQLSVTERHIYGFQKPADYTIYYKGGNQMIDICAE